LRSTFEQTLFILLSVIYHYVLKNRNKKKERNYSTNERNFSSSDSNVPVSPFADYTNFHMLLQQQYPAAQLFMNPMNFIILNKDNDEDEVIKYF
jgi:hypothetical protein